MWPSTLLPIFLLCKLHPKITTIIIVSLPFLKLKLTHYIRDNNTKILGKINDKIIQKVKPLMISPLVFKKQTSMKIWYRQNVLVQIIEMIIVHRMLQHSKVVKQISNNIQLVVIIWTRDQQYHLASFKIVVLIQIASSRLQVVVTWIQIMVQ